jgi:Spy/CpxP family protein refolding chaperone
MDDHRSQPRDTNPRAETSNLKFRRCNFMKYALCTMLFASLLAIPLSASAAPKTHDDSKTEAKPGHHRMSERMKEKLDLTEDQAKKLEAAWQEHREAAKPLREKMHQALRKVHGALEMEASDQDIQAALDQVEKARGALRADSDKLKKTMEALLTPTQRAKMLVMREKMMRRGMEMGRDGRGHEDWRARDQGERHGRKDCERCRRGGRGHEEWGARDRDEDRGERHGREGRKGWEHDQEQEPKDE